jgi:hypothetical protein
MQVAHEAGEESDVYIISNSLIDKIRKEVENDLPTTASTK